MEGREGDPSPRHPSGEKPAPQQQGGRRARGGHRAPGRSPRRHGGEGVREKPRPLRPGPAEGGCRPLRGAPRERPRPGPPLPPLPSGALRLPLTAAAAGGRERGCEAGTPPCGPVLRRERPPRRPEAAQAAAGAGLGPGVAFPPAAGPP